ncbi:MAG TPA: ERAP1-like C-terminal domain-containing protein, partial [Micromonosporaceae bacterium]
REWLQTTGPNTLRPSFTVDGDGRFTSFDVMQTASPEHPTLRSHRIGVGLYSLVNGSLTRTSQVQLDIVGASTPVPALVGVEQPDLVLVNDDDLTYAKIRFDERSTATLREHIGAFDDSLPRALCWTATWDMVRNAEMPARDFIALVFAGIDSETAIGVVGGLLRSVQVSLSRYVDPAVREAETANAARQARTHLAAAEPGSDAQLTWARSFIQLATDESDLDTLVGLLDGSSPMAGLDVDFDLRWAIIARLASTGRFEAAEIEAELDRDRTTTAVSFAAGALAARPTAEAKAEAWTAAGDPDLAKAALDAIAGIRQGGALGLGFSRAAQADLVRPYIDRYFATIAEIWTARPFETARSFIDGFYPRHLIEPATIEATDAYLAAEQPPPALRRLLLENRDEVVRAVAAQQLDARS